MILVTGAGGKTGCAVIQALAQKNIPVRSLARSAERVNTLKRVGATEAVVSDLRNEDDLQRACAGVNAIYFICPNMQPDEVEIASRVFSAAQTAGVTRLVYHSVLHPQTEAMPHHWQKLRVEEFLFTRDFDYTIFQPAAYMQNILAGWSTIVEEGIYRVPYALETRLGMVDLIDVAEAAATVLTEDGHSGATYELCGPELLTQHQVADLLAEVLNRPVRAEAQLRAEWRRSASATLTEYALTTLLAMFDYYEHHDFGGNPNVLTMLLGRRPTTFAEFAQREKRVG